MQDLETKPDSQWVQVPPEHEQREEIYGRYNRLNPEPPVLV